MIPSEQSQEALLPQSFVLASLESNAPSPACDCLAHRFGNAADGPDRGRCYGSDLTEAEWQVIRPLLPVPAWLQGRGGRRAIATA
ncbi:hypothetical protein GCM10010293_45080 [Streptomyces griseoflavus]|nr:hypothetical protein GCM10010293_45080 [Streptomyces griseoflavus]